MDESNPFLPASILARETVKRLQREGHPADAAKRMVAAVINAEESAYIKGRHGFDETRFNERLERLPD